MENHMRLLESIDHTVWTTCEQCGNTYAGGAQQCSRCGNTPTIMQRLANFSYSWNGLKAGPRGGLRRTRSRGTYPGLAETALLSDQLSKRRGVRIALACSMCAGALLTYALATPYLAGIGLSTRNNEAHVLVTGSVIEAGQGSSVLPAQPSSVNAQQNASGESTPTQSSDIGEFHRALQDGSLAGARRRLAGISVSGKDSGQLAQLRTELASREHTRDALLHHAWHCRAIGDWQCVADNATQALAIDASSWEAKHLVALAAKEVGKRADE
jgi:hypothetical protein